MELSYHQPRFPRPAHALLLHHGIMKTPLVSCSFGVLLCLCACGGRSSQSIDAVASDPSDGTSAALTPPAPDSPVASAAATPPVSGAASRCSGAAQQGGAEVWRQSFGERDALNPSSVATDPTGAAFIAWAAGGTSKVDPSGNVVWSKPFGSLVATDRDGNVYVAGTFAGTLDLGVCTLVALGGTDAYVAEIDPDGSVVGCTALGGRGDDAVTGLAVDSRGNAAVSGPGLGTVKVGAGRILWSRELFGHVAVDSAGSVLVTGALTGSAVFGPETLESAGGEDIFVVKLDAEGNYLFSRRFGDAGITQHGDGITVDPWDNILVSGVLDGTADFGGGVVTVPARSCPSETWCEQAGFIAKFDPTGRYLWSRSRAPVRSLPGIASDSHGNVLVSGAYPGNAPPYHLPLLVEFDSDGNDLGQPAHFYTGSLTDAGVGHGVTFDRCDNALWSVSLPAAPSATARSFLAKLALIP